MCGGLQQGAGNGTPLPEDARGNGSLPLSCAHAFALHEVELPAPPPAPSPGSSQRHQAGLLTLTSASRLPAGSSAAASPAAGRGWACATRCCARARPCPRPSAPGSWRTRAWATRCSTWCAPRLGLGLGGARACTGLPQSLRACQDQQPRQGKATRQVDPALPCACKRCTCVAACQFAHEATSGSAVHESVALPQ